MKDWEKHEWPHIKEESGISGSREGILIQKILEILKN